MDHDAPSDAAGQLIRRGMVVGLVPALVVGVIVALALNWIAGVGIAVILGAAWVLLVRSRRTKSVQAILTEISAIPVETEEVPRLANVVDGLCVAAGVSPPELWVVRSDAANGMALDDGGRTAVVVTTGLVDGLGLVALEGAIANLIGRLRDGSARLATTAAGLGELPLASVWMPDRVVANSLGEHYAVRSDLEAVRLTRYPPGMIAALRDLSSVGPEVSGAQERTAHLWLAPVLSKNSAVKSETFLTSAEPLDLRMDVLGEL